MNEKNLIPQNKRTKSEQREIASLGGKKSVVSRRKKKYIKEQLETLMQLDLKDTILTNNMRKLGIEEADMTIQNGIICALVQQALHRKFESISTHSRSNKSKSKRRCH